jgi:hypothetical protein
MNQIKDCDVVVDAIGSQHKVVLNEGRRKHEVQHQAIPARA